jgi:hypothetical protein
MTLQGRSLRSGYNLWTALKVSYETGKKTQRQAGKSQRVMTTIFVYELAWKTLKLWDMKTHSGKINILIDERYPLDATIYLLL